MTAIWTYQAVVKRVVDGDTIVIDLDMGMRVWQHSVSVRLAGINAPETSTPEGIAAKQFLISSLPLGSAVVVRSQKFEKYGRLLAQVEYEGRDIGELMVTSGNAQVHVY